MDDDVEILGRGRHLTLLRRAGWEYATRNQCSGGVAIIAVSAAGELVLVEQERPTVRARVIELPAGLAGDHVEHADEDLACAAARELREETGFAAESFERLFVGPPSAGIGDELVTFFRARGLRRVGDGGGDEHEAITVHLVPLATLDVWLRARQDLGLLVDPRVYAGAWFARAEM